MEDKKEDTYKVIEPKDNCALLCRSLDKLVLVNAHAEVVDTIRAVLDKNKAFNGEIKNYSRITCAFVLNSAPFEKGWFENDSVKIKHVLGEIIGKLLEINWRVVVSSNLARVDTHSCIFFQKFAKCTGQEGPLQCSEPVFSVCPSGKDKIALVSVPNVIEADLKEAISESWKVEKYEILEEQETPWWSLDRTTWQGQLKTSMLTLDEKLWQSPGAESAVKLRRMMLRIIQVARRHSFEMIVNSDTKGQLISKCPYEKLVSSKTQQKYFWIFCPEIFCSFLGASW